MPSCQSKARTIDLSLSASRRVRSARGQLHDHNLIAWLRVVRASPGASTSRSSNPLALVAKFQVEYLSERQGASHNGLNPPRSRTAQSGTWREVPSEETQAVAQDIANAISGATSTYTGDTGLDHLYVRASHISQRTTISEDTLRRFVGALASRLDHLPTVILPSLSGKFEAQTKNAREIAASRVGISVDELAAWDEAVKGRDLLQEGAFAAAGREVGISAEVFSAWGTEIQNLRTEAAKAFSGRVLHIEYDTPRVIVDAATEAGMTRLDVDGRLPTKTNYEMSPGRAVRFQYGIPAWPLIELSILQLLTGKALRRDRLESDDSLGTATLQLRLPERAGSYCHVLFRVFGRYWSM